MKNGEFFVESALMAGRVQSTLQGREQDIGIH